MTMTSNVSETEPLFDKDTNKTNIVKEYGLQQAQKLHQKVKSSAEQMQTKFVDLRERLKNELGPTANALGIAVASQIHDSTEKMKQTQYDGMLNYVAFIGGVALIILNTKNILFHVLTLRFSGCLLSIYGIILGFAIFILEVPGPQCKKMKSHLQIYAKFLELSWGKGTFHIFVGSLEILQLNFQDQVVGWFMIATGILLLVHGSICSNPNMLFYPSLEDDEKLVTKWDRFDSVGDGTLDVQEFTKFLTRDETEINMQQIGAIFMSLNKTFIDRISLEEFLACNRCLYDTKGRTDGQLIDV